MAFQSFRSLMGYSTAKTSIDLPPVRVEDIEKGIEKQCRTLKHLIKANHADKAIIGDENQPNLVAVHLGSAYLVGASSEKLIQIFDENEKKQAKWEDSPQEVIIEDWVDFVGYPQYQRAFIDFFEDQLLEFSYDWKKLLDYFLFESEKPLLNHLMNGGSEALVHLAYGLKLSSRTLAIEALAMACCCKRANSAPSLPAEAGGTNFASKSPKEIFAEIAQDDGFEKVIDNHAILEYGAALDMSDLQNQFQTMYKLAVQMAISDKTAMPTLHSLYAIRVLIPMISKENHVSLIRQWWLLAIKQFVSQGRKIKDMALSESKPQDWSMLQAMALSQDYGQGAYILVALVAMREAATTWLDDSDFYLQAANMLCTDAGGRSGR